MVSRMLKRRVAKSGGAAKSDSRSGSNLPILRQSNTILCPMYRDQQDITRHYPVYEERGPWEGTSATLSGSDLAHLYCPIEMSWSMKIIKTCSQRLETSSSPQVQASPSTSLPKPLPRCRNLLLGLSQIIPTILAIPLSLLH